LRASLYIEKALDYPLYSLKKKGTFLLVLILGRGLVGFDVLA